MKLYATSVQFPAILYQVLQEIEAFLPPDEKIRARFVAGNMMFEGDSALKKIQVLN